MDSSNITIIIYSLVVLLFSAILHEIAHGAVAEYFGDDTARLMGRITLNPIRHIDPYFTVLLPVMLALFHSPIFGAAKPVPVNYYNLRNFRWGVFWVSIAGVLTNLLLAFILTLPLHAPILGETVRQLLIRAAQINIFLVLINLLPIPPIDGSKVFAALLGRRAIEWIMSIEMRGLIGLLPFIVIIYLIFANGGFQITMLTFANSILKLFGVPIS